MTDVNRDAASRLARTLKAWGLASLAETLLRDSSPLGFLAAQALYFAAPVLDLFGGGDDLAGLAHVLEDPARLARVAAHLEDGS